MNRAWASVAIRQAAAWGLALGSAFFFFPASGYGRGVRDDQIPYGPEGTIGRGTDYQAPSGRRRNGDGYSYLPLTARPDNLPSRRPGWATGAVRSATQPYRTTQYYEPGSGTRYPIYYSPASRTYFFYLVPPR